MKKVFNLEGLNKVAILMVFRKMLEPEKRQPSCNELLQNCITACERTAAAGASNAAIAQCKEKIL